jgi:hypothetical protein
MAASSLSASLSLVGRHGAAAQLKGAKAGKRTTVARAARADSNNEVRELWIAIDATPDCHATNARPASAPQPLPHFQHNCMHHS